MAEPQSLAQRIGLTRGKGALVGVLAVVMIGVMYIQYGPTDDGAALVDAGQAAAPPTLPQVAAQALPAPPVTTEVLDPAGTAAFEQEPTAVTAQFDEARWKSPELTMVVAYDPFALPSAFPQPVRTAAGEQAGDADGGDSDDAAAAAAKLAEALESLQTELRNLQERGVHVIIRGRDQYVAMIGNRIVQVGEEIEGFTITAIEADGVRVERKLSE